MSRWNAHGTLYAISFEIDGTGQQVEVRTATPTYVNMRQMGATAWMAARSAGLHADAHVEVPTFDYDGQQVIEIDGTEYTVERVQAIGDVTYLTLERRLANE